MKNNIFWDITLCSPLKVNGRFGETYRLHIQSRKIKRPGNPRNQETNRALHILNTLAILKANTTSIICWPVAHGVFGVRALNVPSVKVIHQPDNYKL
jgi:hypothetical protein